MLAHSETPSAATRAEPLLADVRAVARYLAVSPATVWRLVQRDPDFPRPLTIFHRCTRWRLDEVASWVATRQGRGD